MADRSIIRYGNMPVPYTVLWSGEAGGMTIAHCPFANHLAMTDEPNRGAGKPLFGKPHMTRQREAIINDLCDLCGRSLKTRTKVSLSHARTIVTGAEGLAVLQVEPMIHRECAFVCVEECPSLKRDIQAGTLFVRQVAQHRTQLAILTEAAVEEFIGVRAKGIVGHAKVELLRWVDRDLDWLHQRATA